MSEGVWAGKAIHDRDDVPAGANAASIPTGAAGDGAHSRGGRDADIRTGGAGDEVSIDGTDPAPGVLNGAGGGVDTAIFAEGREELPLRGSMPRGR